MKLYNTIKKGRRQEDLTKMNNITIIALPKCYSDRTFYICLANYYKTFFFKLTNCAKHFQFLTTVP